MCQILDVTKTKVNTHETIDFLSLDNTLHLNKGPTTLFTVKSSFGYFSWLPDFLWPFRDVVEFFLHQHNGSRSPCHRGQWLHRRPWKAIDYSLRLIKEVVLYSDTFFKAQLWLLVFTKIFIKKWYMYIFMKVFFKINLFMWFSLFQTQQLKSYSWFIFPMFNLNLVQNDLFYQHGASTNYQLRTWMLASSLQ